MGRRGKGEGGRRGKGLVGGRRRRRRTAEGPSDLSFLYNFARGHVLSRVSRFLSSAATSGSPPPPSSAPLS